MSLDTKFANIHYKIGILVYILYFGYLVVVCEYLAISHLGTIKGVAVSFIGILVYFFSLWFYEYYNKYNLWSTKHIYNLDSGTQFTGSGKQ